MVSNTAGGGHRAFAGGGRRAFAGRTQAERENGARA
jgi:hypothetical protein